MSMLAQRSLAGGEIGPQLYSRVDVQKYATALRTQRNAITMRSGGIQARPGSRFISETKDSTKTCRLIPFIFSSDQAYVLEVGYQYIRFIKNADYIYEAAKTITGITHASPGVVTSNAHGYSNGDEVYISTIVGMTQLNGKSFKVAGVTANTFTLTDLGGAAINTTSYTTYSSAGTTEKVYTVTTTYAEADLPYIKVTQNADIMLFSHNGYVLKKLTRASDTSWTFATVTFAPSIAAPTGTAVGNVGAAGASFWGYYISAVGADGIESIATAAVTGTGNATLSSANYNHIIWNAVSGAQFYRVYKARWAEENPWFIGTTSTSYLYFNDTGFGSAYGYERPDLDAPILSCSNTPIGDKPATSIFYQQRLLMAGADTYPENLLASKIANYYVYPTVVFLPYPILSDSEMNMRIVGKRLNRINHIVDVGGLLIFTSDGEWALRGAINATEAPDVKQYSYNGASRRISPIVINDTALYVQAAGNMVRDIVFNFSTDGFVGTDLTAYAPHLFKNKTIVDMAYMKSPQPIAFVVLSDGTMLGLTYVKDQQIWAWHRHDTGRPVGAYTTSAVPGGFDIGQGFFENVCVIQEGTEDVVYVVVKRRVNGRTRRYIERLSLTEKDDIIDETIMDSHLSYDGRNIGINMTLTGGTTWDGTEFMTLTAASAYFTSADVGNAIHFNYLELDTDLNRYTERVLRCTITSYTSTTVVKCQANKTVPVALRGVAWTDCDKAVKSVTGLDHLEGYNVAVFADAAAVGSPNNASYTVYTVSSGAITLDRAYTVIHAGIPILADIETLDIDTVQGETISDKKSIVTAVACRVESSRGFWAGGKPPTSDTDDPLEGLAETAVREFESYDDPVDSVNEVLEVQIDNTYSSGGRVFIRNVEPIPLKILSIQPAGLFPIRG